MKVSNRSALAASRSPAIEITVTPGMCWQANVNGVIAALR
jgi:hypothetical protein